MLKKFGQVLLAGAFAVILPGSLAAQNYKLITSKAEFISLMSNRTITDHKGGDTKDIYHDDGRMTGDYDDGRKFVGNWTWDGTGICISGEIIGKWKIDPGCAEVSVSGSSAKLTWRDFAEEYFTIGN